MYLILTITAAVKRNSKEATKRGWKVPNAAIWNSYKNETMCALDVLDGEGLTDVELSECVNDLPIEFIPESIL